MKTSVKLLFSSFLVLTLLFASLSTVMADSADTPTVTPVSGDTTFTTKLVSVEVLPGTTTLGEMKIPVGFPTGEAQFGGNGVIVSGMDYGKATVCSFIKTVEVEQGWGGKVAEWTGEKWNQLDTTITMPEEGTLATACATITGSGTYAFIKYVVDPSLLPKMPKCPFTATPYFYHHDSDTVLSADLIGDSIPAEGTIVYYKVLSFEPEGALTGLMEGSIEHGIFGSHYSDFITVIVDTETIESATLYVQYPTCTFILHYDSSTGWDG